MCYAEGSMLTSNSAMQCDVYGDVKRGAVPMNVANLDKRPRLYIILETRYTSNFCSRLLYVIVGRMYVVSEHEPPVGI